jgi:hypothetical protein
MNIVSYNTHYLSFLFQNFDIIPPSNAAAPTPIATVETQSEEYVCCKSPASGLCSSTAFRDLHKNQFKNYATLFRKEIPLTHITGMDIWKPEAAISTLHILLLRTDEHFSKIHISHHCKMQDLSVQFS